MNAILSGVQQRNLESAWGLPVLDRVGLIIGIFAQRARSREARLQVPFYPSIACCACPAACVAGRPTWRLCMPHTAVITLQGYTSWFNFPWHNSCKRLIKQLTSLEGGKGVEGSS